MDTYAFVLLLMLVFVGLVFALLVSVIRYFWRKSPPRAVNS